MNSNLSPQDIKEINEFRDLFPQEIDVRVGRSEDGGFIAEVLTFPGVLTEADTFSELIAMVNDAVATHFEVPERFAAYVANYLPPIEVAQDVGIYPNLGKESELTLQRVS